MFVVLFTSIFITIIALLVLASRSKNIFGKVLAVNVLGTVIAILMTTLGAMLNEPDYFDIALLYMLLNFTSTLALLHFFRSRQIPSSLLRDVSKVPLDSEAQDPINLRKIHTEIKDD